MPTRFIPAGAGNTTINPVLGLIAPVHPRGCGEHSASGRRRLGTRGSSPRVRGTPHDPALVDGGERFIPAGAGNTQPRRECMAGSTVHPRGCGEHEVLVKHFTASYGSSPRVRGTL